MHLLQDGTRHDGRADVGRQPAPTKQRPWERESDASHYNVRILDWRIVDGSDHSHVLESDGPVTVRFRCAVHHDAPNRPSQHRVDERGSNCVGHGKSRTSSWYPGTQELGYRFPSLPLSPGALHMAAGLLRITAACWTRSIAVLISVVGNRSSDLCQAGMDRAVERAVSVFARARRSGRDGARWTNSSDRSRFVDALPERRSHLRESAVSAHVRRADPANADSVESLVRCGYEPICRRRQFGWEAGFPGPTHSLRQRKSTDFQARTNFRNKGLSELFLLLRWSMSCRPICRS